MTARARRKKRHPTVQKARSALDMLAQARPVSFSRSPPYVIPNSRRAASMAKRCSRASPPRTSRSVEKRSLTRHRHARCAPGGARHGSHRPAQRVGLLKKRPSFVDDLASHRLGSERPQSRRVAASSSVCTASAARPRRRVGGRRTFPSKRRRRRCDSACAGRGSRRWSLRRSRSEIPEWAHGSRSAARGHDGSGQMK